MVKQTQAICRLLPANSLNVFDHFVGLALKGLSEQKEYDQPDLPSKSTGQ